MRDFMTAAFFAETDLLAGDPVTPFESLDLSRAALLGWISLTLAALSKAEKTACRSLAVLVVLTFLIRVL